MSDELKPCPFCGCTANFQKTITDASIWCLGCRVNVVRVHYMGQTKDWDATPRVIAAWNRRTTEPGKDGNNG